MQSEDLKVAGNGKLASRVILLIQKRNGLNGAAFFKKM